MIKSERSFYDNKLIKQMKFLLLNWKSINVFPWPFFYGKFLLSSVERRWNVEKIKNKNEFTSWENDVDWHLEKHSAEIKKKELVFLSYY